MERKETIEFMQRIKSHYQEFIIDDFKIDEWHKELKKYDYADVNKKLDEHLASETYGEYIPKVHFLTKHLIESKDKGKIRHYVVKCQLCNKDIPDELYDSHFKRCLSSKTIVKDMEYYFKLKVDYEQLMKMSEQEFEKTYVRYLNKMTEAKNLPELRKKVILQCLYPDKDTNINDLLESWS